MVLVVVAGLTAALGWQARHFRVDASPDTLLTPDNEHYIETRIVEERFGSSESLVVAYQPTAHDLLSPATFEDLRQLTEELSALPRVASVRSLLNVPLPSPEGEALAGDDLSNSTLQDREWSYSDLPELLRGHPIYEGLLIDPDQTVTALQIRFATNEPLEALERDILALERRTLDGELEDAEAERLEKLQQQAEPLRQQLARTRAEEMTQVRRIISDFDDDANLYIGGIHALEQGLIEIIEHDLRLFGTVIAIAVCVLLLVLFRSVPWMLIPVAACGASVAGTIGTFVLLDLEVTVISANFVALQIILTLAIAMHLIVEYRQRQARQPDDSTIDLVRHTLARKWRPCLYAGLTTSVGFGSLVLSGIQPVISFGWMMIVATLISLALTLALFPALVVVLRPKVSPATAEGLLDRLLRWLAHVASGRRRTVVASSGVLLVAGLAGCLLLEVENSFLAYFDESTEVHRDLSFIDRNLTGTTPLDLVYTLPPEASAPDRILTAEGVQELQRIHQRLESHEAIGKVLSVTSFTALARRLNDDRPITETELTAAYRLIPEATRDELIGGFFDPQSGEVRFSARIRDTTPNLDRSALLDAVRSDMQQLDIPTERYSLSNLAVLYDDILDRLFTSQVLTLGVVLAALGIAFWISFGSLRVAMIALIPNLLAAATVFGTMGWLGIELDVMTITIAAVTMGIAVDDTIHYVHRHLELSREDDIEAATLGTHRSVGVAIFYTTAIIALGFSLLMTSSFVPSEIFGGLTALAMVVAMLADLTLLPVLLAWWAPSHLPPDHAG